MCVFISFLDISQISNLFWVRFHSNRHILQPKNGKSLGRNGKQTNRSERFRRVLNEVAAQLLLLEKTKAGTVLLISIRSPVVCVVVLRCIGLRPWRYNEVNLKSYCPFFCQGNYDRLFTYQVSHIIIGNEYFITQNKSQWKLNKHICFDVIWIFSIIWICWQWIYCFCFEYGIFSNIAPFLSNFPFHQILLVRIMGTKIIWNFFIIWELTFRIEFF